MALVQLSLVSFVCLRSLRVDQEYIGTWTSILCHNTKTYHETLGCYGIVVLVRRVKQSVLSYRVSRTASETYVYAHCFGV